MIREPLEGLQWKLFLKENYQTGKSLIIFKQHHVLTDGYGLGALLNAINDKPAVT